MGRAQGPFIYVNSNDLSTITLLALGATLWVLATEPMQKSLRMIGYGFAGTLVVMMLLTQSRGGFLGLVVLGVPYALSAARRGIRPLIVILAAAIGAAIFVPTSAWERLAGMKKLTSTQTIAEADVEGSAEQRYELAKAGLDVIWNHPVSGVGLKAIGVAFAPYRRGIAGRDTHNTYLSIGAEIGLPGLAIFLIMVVTVWKTLTRARRATRTTAPSISTGFGYLQYSFLGFLVACFFGSYAWLSIFHLFLAIMWSGAMLWITPPAAAPARSALPVVPERPQPVVIRRRAPVVPRRGR
jgi:O-antigen ligase